MGFKKYVKQRCKAFVVNAMLFLVLLGVAIYFLGVPKFLMIPNVLLLIGYVTIEILEYKAWKERQQI